MAAAGSIWALDISLVNIHPIDRPGRPFFFNRCGASTRRPCRWRCPTGTTTASPPPASRGTCVRVHVCAYIRLVHGLLIDIDRSNPCPDVAPHDRHHTHHHTHPPQDRPLPPAAGVGVAQEPLPAAALPALRVPTGARVGGPTNGMNSAIRPNPSIHPPTQPTIQSNVPFQKHTQTKTQGNPHNPALSALIQALPSFPNLDALALEYRNVRCEDCLALAAAVASGRACGKLRSLSVSCNFLRKVGVSGGIRGAFACFDSIETWQGWWCIHYSFISLALHTSSTHPTYSDLAMAIAGGRQGAGGLPPPPARPAGAGAQRQLHLLRGGGRHLRGPEGRRLPAARALQPRLQLGGRPRQPRDRCVPTYIYTYIYTYIRSRPPPQHLSK